jgi:hypothetical protein
MNKVMIENSQVHLQVSNAFLEAIEHVVNIDMRKNKANAGGFVPLTAAELSREELRLRVAVRHVADGMFERRQALEDGSQQNISSAGVNSDVTERKIAELNRLDEYALATIPGLLTAAAQIKQEPGMPHAYSVEGLFVGEWGIDLGSRLGGAAFDIATAMLECRSLFEIIFTEDEEDEDHDLIDEIMKSIISPLIVAAVQTKPAAGMPVTFSVKDFLNREGSGDCAHRLGRAAYAVAAEMLWWFKSEKEAYMHQGLNEEKIAALRVLEEYMTAVIPAVIAAAAYTKPQGGTANPLEKLFYSSEEEQIKDAAKVLCQAARRIADPMLRMWKMSVEEENMKLPEERRFDMYESDLDLKEGMVSVIESVARTPQRDGALHSFEQVLYGDQAWDVSVDLCEEAAKIAVLLIRRHIDEIKRNFAAYPKKNSDGTSNGGAVVCN